MLTTRWIRLAAATLVVLGTGAGLLLAQARRDDRGGARTTVHGIVKSVDAAKGAVVITVNGAGRCEVEDKSYTVPVTAEVAVGIGTGRRIAALRAAKLADFAPGALV